MTSTFKLAAVSLALATLAAVSTPAFADPVRVELGFSNGYGQQAWVQPGAIYEAPAPLYRYRDGDGWRQQQWRDHEWRERERREHYWRERNEWRARQWQEQRWHEHEDHERYDQDRHGDWR